MCLLYSEEETRKYKSLEESTLTLYKVYSSNGIELESPYFGYLKSGIIRIGGEYKTDQIEDRSIPSWHSRGFHCFVRKEDAIEYIADLRPKYSDKSRWRVVEVQVSTENIIAAGVTAFTPERLKIVPGVTDGYDPTVQSLCPEYFDHPTLVVSKITISQEEFDKATVHFKEPYVLKV